MFWEMRDLFNLRTNEMQRLLNGEFVNVKRRQYTLQMIL
jgi:hypothetical protein